MLSIQLSNIPFYVLERKKCVNLRNICPSKEVVGFSGFRQKILHGDEKNSVGGCVKGAGGSSSRFPRNRLFSCF